MMQILLESNLIKMIKIIDQMSAYQETCEKNYKKINIITKNKIKIIEKSHNESKRY